MWSKMEGHAIDSKQGLRRTIQDMDIAIAEIERCRLCYAERQGQHALQNTWRLADVRDAEKIE